LSITITFFVLKALVGATHLVPIHFSYYTVDVISTALVNCDYQHIKQIIENLKQNESKHGSVFSPWQI